MHEKINKSKRSNHPLSVHVISLYFKLRLSFTTGGISCSCDNCQAFHVCICVIVSQQGRRRPVVEEGVTGFVGVTCKPTQVLLSAVKTFEQWISLLSLEWVFKWLCCQRECFFLWWWLHFSKQNYAKTLTHTHAPEGTQHECVLLLILRSAVCENLITVWMSSGTSHWISGVGAGTGPLPCLGGARLSDATNIYQQWSRNKH